jgi:uncharacterized lipoprotein YehR (DUF1307 family)
MKNFGKKLIVLIFGVALLSLTACGDKRITREFDVPTPASQSMTK